MPPHIPGLLKLPEAAAKYGLSEDKLYNYCHRSRLKYERHFGHMYIADAQIQEFLEKKRMEGSRPEGLDPDWMTFRDAAKAVDYSEAALRAAAYMCKIKEMTKDFVKYISVKDAAGYVEMQNKFRADRAKHRQRHIQSV